MLMTKYMGFKILIVYVYERKLLSDSCVRSMLLIYFFLLIEDILLFQRMAQLFDAVVKTKKPAECGYILNSSSSMDRQKTFAPQLQGKKIPIIKWMAQNISEYKLSGELNRFFNKHLFLICINHDK